MRPLYAVVGVALVFSIAVGVSNWLTPNWRVERVADIGASPADIHRFVADFSEWGRWAQFREAEDPQVRLEHTDEDGVPVQRILVNGAERTRIRMEQSTPAQVTVTVQEPFSGRQTFRYLVLDENTTRVIWEDEGTVSTPLIGGLLAYNLAERLGDHHEIALRKLRALAESVDQEPVRSDR
ncbi:MAG: SRPBCC family protein [Myxococcota bacterium]